MSAVSKQVATMLSWVAGADFTGGDAADAGMDALGDGVAEGGQPPHRGQGAAELFGQRRVHQAVQSGAGAGFGRGEVADHEVSDVGLVAEMPADRAGVLVRAPCHLVRGEVLPQFVGVAASTVVLAQQRLCVVHD